MQEKFQQGGTGLSGENRGFQNWAAARMLWLDRQH